MKIVHISTYDHGGAGLATYRLHRGLLAAGVDSLMLVSSKNQNDDTVFQLQPAPELLYHPPRNVVLKKTQKVMRRRGCFLTDAEKADKALSKVRSLFPDVYYTSPVTAFDLLKNRFVQEADVIHLHWVQNFLNYSSFFANVKKPIVWTFHDLNPLYGGFHYMIPRTQHYNDIKYIEDEFYTIKKNAINQVSNLSIVAISKQMHFLIANHEIYRDKPIYDIPNSVNGASFIQHDRNTIRKLLNIPLNDTVFFFSSLDLNEKRKGLNILIEALELLNLDNVLLICLGDGSVPSNKNIKIRHFFPVSDTEWLSMLYSAADYFVAPSLEESFLQTALESLCCGTPVIMTSVGIGNELITEHNGILCSDFSSESLSNGIMNALNRTYDRDEMRRDVLERYGVDVVTKRYLNTYNTIIM